MVIHTAFSIRVPTKTSAASWKKPSIENAVGQARKIWLDSRLEAGQAVLPSDDAVSVGRHDSGS